jgi:hypothetical protein
MTLLKAYPLVYSSPQTRTGRSEMPVYLGFTIPRVLYAGGSFPGGIVRTAGPTVVISGVWASSGNRYGYL